MANEKQQIVIDIEVKADAALAELQALQAQEAKLKQERENLGEITDANRATYNAYTEAIKANRKEQQEQSKVIQNTIKKFKSASDSLTAMKARLSNVTKEFNDLSKAEREGAKGKELLDEINALTDSLNENEQAMQNYRRNVGNYKSAVEGLLPLQNTMLGKIISISQSLPSASTAFQGVGAAAKSFGKQLLQLCANPFVAIAAVIATLIIKIVQAFKQNEAATNGVKKAFAALNPIIDAIRNAFNFLAEGIANVVGWIANLVAGSSEAAQAAQEIEQAQQDVVKRQRELEVEAAQSDKEVSELRAKIADKDKYTKEQRIAMLDEAIKKETELAQKRKALADEELRLAQDEIDRGDKSAEAQDKLAQAKVNAINAEKQLADKQRELIGQRSELVAGIKAEEDARKKAALDAKMKKEAEAAAAAKKAYDDYSAATKDLVARFNEVRQMVVQNENEQIEAIRAKYDAAIQSAGDYTKEIEALSSKGSLTQAESERLEQLEAMQLDAADTAYRLEEQKQAEITAIQNNSAKERIDAAIAAIDEQHAVELAKAKNNADATAEIETQALKEKAEAYKAAMADEDLSREERLQAEVNYYTTLAELEAADLERQMANQEAINANLEASKQKRLEIIDEISGYADQAMQAVEQISELMSNLEEAQLDEYEEQNDAKKEALQDRLDDGLISQEEYDAGVAAADAELEQQRKDMELKQAKREKAIALMQAIIQTALAVATAVAQSPMTGGLPGSAIAAAMGAIQIATIAAEPLPKASRGTLLQGKSHAEGGIKIEAEGGEAIINKRSTAHFRPLLSAINEWGGGVKFANGGIPLDGGYSVRQAGLFAASVTKDDLAAVANTPIYTTVTDIKRETGRYSQVQAIKTY